jgi:dienelactone hydrolase
MVTRKDVEIPFGSGTLRGILDIPEDASAVVAFAHGSGSGRLSPRNGSVARALNDAGLATLLLDLLTVEEERVDARTGHLRFDIDLLARRLSLAVAWLGRSEWTAFFPIGLFGASTGAAAALQVAAREADSVAAVVSRGGRPDLALQWLPAVLAPTLLIVGSEDTEVISLNEQAARALRAPHQLELVAGATHLFEEPGALDEVSRLAREWFVEHLALARRVGT